ncbi:MAG: pyridoxamine 5'-phosphate oxidase family protein [Candidatus Methanomethylophilaceae archaeon]|nr:pyridoxamine 5'-phosphate oxidase family protein [Candidatus Methanomethylophilaceae archaeon]
MSTFNELCKRLEEMDDDSFNKTFNQLSVRVMEDLGDLTDSAEDAYNVYLQFLLAAVAADGKLSEDEFVLLKPLFDKSAGHDVDFPEGVEMFKEMGLDDSSDLKDIADLMVDLIELASPEAKDDIVMLCLMVCAIDREVTPEEKEWIAQLIKPLEVELTPMETVNAFLEKAGSFVLATNDGDQPRMRVLGFKTVLDGKIYFGIGTFKDVYAQLQKQPKCEILAFDGQDFIRWDGRAVFSNDQRLAMAAGVAMPEIVQMYIDNGWNMGFFTLEDGTAEIVSTTEKTKLF